MKFKKILTLFLSAVMILGIAAGCTGGASDPVETTRAAGDGTTAPPITDTPEDILAAVANIAHDDRMPDLSTIPGFDLNGPPVHLTVYSQTANYSGKSTGWFAKIMKDMFNVEMTIIPQPDPGIFDTRMESGFLGDIVIFGSNGNQYQRAVTEGMLFDWNEDNLLSEYGPYIKAAAPFAIEHNANMNLEKTGINKVFGMGYDIATSSDDIISPLYTWDIRWDLYSQLGYPEVNSIDDLVQLFIEMKKLSPTDANGSPSYAVSMWPDWDDNYVMYVKAFATAYWGHDEFDFGHYDVETGEFYYVGDESSPYVDALRFFNRLSREGLVDPNSMVQKYEDMSKKLLSDGVFFSMFNYSGSLTYNIAENLEQGKFMYSLFPSDATPIAEAMNVKGGTRVWSIGSNTEYPELCMAIINWLTTPEGAMTYYNGPKDLCWFYDDEGYPVFTEYGEKAYRDSRNTNVPEEWGGGMHNDGTFQGNNTIWARSTTNPDSNGESYHPDLWSSRRTGAEYDIIQDWMDHTGFYDFDEYFRSRPYKIALSPASGFVADKRSPELETIWRQMSRSIRDYSWKAIDAKTEDEFNSLVEQMKKQLSEYDPEGVCKQWSIEQAAKRFAMEQAMQ